MSEASKSWRQYLFKAGVAGIFIDIALFLAGIATVSTLATANAQIRAGAWFFLIGSCVSITASTLILFGYGWKRFLWALACLFTLPFWVGFTLY
jgi:hypothetical protein